VQGSHGGGQVGVRVGKKKKKKKEKKARLGIALKELRYLAHLNMGIYRHRDR